MPGQKSEMHSHDVRMRGFTHRATVEAAIAWVDSVSFGAVDLPEEEIRVVDAADRVLSREIASETDVPRFARSMMDGFALRADETFGATSYNPLLFQIVGTCLPGVPFPATVTPGHAVRIMTGAPLPAGADAVLPVEYTEVQGETLRALADVSAGKHIGTVGEDVRQGEVILHAGRRLRPQDLGVLSSIGKQIVPVVRRPKVRVLITGNELLPACTRPMGFQIADANGPMLAALIARDGGEVVDARIVPDDPEDLKTALLEPADIVIVSGGSSVGQEDYAPNLLAELGELAIHGVAMRPSSPTGMGRIRERLVFLLPGNPVSCLCAYDFFAGRAIRALGGRSRDWPYRRMLVRLARKLVSTVGRVDYARLQVDGNVATPMSIGGASVLSSTTRADGFMIIPADCEGFPEGTEIEIFLY